MGIVLLIIIAVFVLILILGRGLNNQSTSKPKSATIADVQRQEHVGYMETIREGQRELELFRQAKLVGDTETIEALKNDNYKGPYPEEWESGTYYSSLYPDKLLIINIAGINHRSGLSSCIGQFNGLILPDPKNEYDNHAIKIKNAEGKFLGFVPENQTEMVRNFIGHPDADGDTKWRHRITGYISQQEEWNSNTDKMRKYYTGYINVTNNMEES